MPSYEMFPSGQGPSGGAVVSSEAAERGAFNAVDVEFIPSGDSPSGAFSVLDSGVRAAGFNPTVDTAGNVGTITAYKKIQVVGVMDWIRVQATVTAGTWFVRVTPISVPNATTISATLSSAVSQGTPITADKAWPVEVTDGASNVIGTVAHPAVVDTELPAAAALADATANPTAPQMGAAVELWGGTTWDLGREIAASGAGLGVQQVGTLGEAVTLAASAARTAGANGTPVTGLGWRRRYLIVLDVTAAASLVGDTLDAYVDVSIDGSKWLNAVHFAQILGNGGAKSRFAVLEATSPGTSDLDATADAAVGTVRPTMAGLPQLRARWAIANGGGTHSFTFSLVAWAI